MKNRIGYLTMLCFTALLLTFCSKDDEDDETCNADEFCDATVTVTYCCTDDVCVYKYDDKEYPDTNEGLSDLNGDIECTTAGADLIPSLRSLAVRTKSGL